MCRRGMPGFFDGNGGMRKCGGVTLKSDLSDLSDLSDKMGASCDTPWVCLPLCGLARAKSCRRVVLGLLDGCGGMQSAHGVTLA